MSETTKTNRIILAVLMSSMMAIGGILFALGALATRGNMSTGDETEMLVEYNNMMTKNRELRRQLRLIKSQRDQCQRIENLILDHMDLEGP